MLHCETGVAGGSRSLETEGSRDGGICFTSHTKQGTENTRGTEPKRRQREEDLGCSRPGPREPDSLANVSAPTRHGGGDGAARPATAREAVHTISVAIEHANSDTRPLFVAKKHARIASEGGGCPSEGCRMQAMRTKSTEARSEAAQGSTAGRRRAEALPRLSARGGRSGR